MSNDKELKILIPDEELETSAGKITLRPFKFKDFSKALELVSKYLDVFMESESAVAIAQVMLTNAGEQTLADLAILVELCSGKERNFIDNLSWDEVFQILVAIVEQNMDFFYRLGDRMSEKVKSRQKVGTDGEKPSAA